MTEKEVNDVLLDLGITPAIDGFFYIRYIVTNTYDERIIEVIKAYKKTAQHFDTKWNRVERSIRYAIESSSERANREAFDEIFKYSYSPQKGMPTNSEFIATIKEHLKQVNKC